MLDLEWALGQVDNQEERSKSVVIIPIAIKVDDFNFQLGRIESPNKALHNILTHNLEKEIEKERKINDKLCQQQEDKICKDENLSPRLDKTLKSSRKRQW